MLHNLRISSRTDPAFADSVAELLQSTSRTLILAVGSIYILWTLASLTVIMLPLFWNQFLEPYVYLDPGNTTLLPLIQNYSGQYTTNYQITYTGVFVSVLPLVVVYLLLRDWFIRGVMAGAVKG